MPTMPRFDRNGDAPCHDPDLISVRLLANWCDSRTLCDLFNRMTTDGRYEWRFDDMQGAPRRLRIIWDDDEPDYWAVVNAPPPGEPVLDPRAHGRLPDGAADVVRDDAGAVGRAGRRRARVVPAGARPSPIPQLVRLAGSA